MEFVSVLGSPIRALTMAFPQNHENIVFFLKLKFFDLVGNKVGE